MLAKVLMRQVWVVFSVVVVAAACGGRSEFFDPEDTGGSSGHGGKGTGGKGTGGDGTGGDGTGGKGGKGSGATGGISGDGAGAVGGFGASGGFAAIGGTGNVGAFGGVSPRGGGGGVSGVGAIGGVGAVGAVGGGPIGGGGGTSGRGGTGGVGGMSGTGGFAGASPATCLTCLGEACPSASDCFANPACVQGIFCGIGSCSGNGSSAFECWLACFNGDTGVALVALQAALCLGENCAMACQSFTP
jgi:hypothetical protein